MRCPLGSLDLNHIYPPPIIAVGISAHMCMDVFQHLNMKVVTEVP